MRKYFIFLFLALTFITNTAYANISTTSGIIPGQIWYSADSFKEGDTVKIYTGVWNGSKAPLSVKIEFYDKNVILGTRDVIIPAEDLIDVSVSWKVTLGDHAISAKIISSNLTTGKKDAVVLSSVSTKEDKKFIPKVIKNADGTTTVVSDELQNKTEQIGSTILDSLPAPVASTLNGIDGFRSNISESVNASRIATQQRIDSYNTPAEESAVDTNINDKTSVKSETPKISPQPQSGTDKPIAYIKIFFLSVLAFIFGHKLIFYGLLIFIIFYTIRKIYRLVVDR